MNAIVGKTLQGFARCPPRTASIVTIKSFATTTRKKEKMRERQRSFAAKHNPNSSENGVPEFQTLLRNLYKRSHPDLLRGNHPDIADINDSSMQILNGVLSTIKTSEFPPAIIKKLPFWIKDPKSGQLVCKMLNIQTAGGYSKNQLTACFEEFFESKFTWGKDYWVEIDKVEDSSEKNAVKEA